MGSFQNQGWACDPRLHRNRQDKRPAQYPAPVRSNLESGDWSPFTPGNTSARCACNLGFAHRSCPWKTDGAGAGGWDSWPRSPRPAPPRSRPNPSPGLPTPRMSCPTPAQAATSWSAPGRALELLTQHLPEHWLSLPSGRHKCALQHSGVGPRGLVPAQGSTRLVLSLALQCAEWVQRGSRGPFPRSLSRAHKPFGKGSN